MLPVSRLYSFLDHKNGFNVHFLEGQKFIEDLVLNHPMQGSGFAYFRDTLLGIMPLVFFLKPAETLGIYIDSEDPYFRLKIETGSTGHTRTLLLPEEFNVFPKTITGNVRVTKIFPNQKAPYTSMIEVKDVDAMGLINQVFEESYQTNSEVIVSEISDQSVLVTKLPPININKNLDETVPRKEYTKKHKDFFHKMFEAATTDIEKIVKDFEDNGFAYLGSRQLSFFCPCSQERMVLNLRGLYSKDIDELFAKEDTLEIKCDYCRKVYQISKADLIGS